MSKLFLSLCLCLTFFFFQSTKSELFTALVDLAKVISAEKKIREIISDFITEEEQRLEKLEDLSNDIKNLDLKNVKSNDDYEVEKYFSNPINTFLFTKKFAVEWKDKLDILTGFSKDEYFEELKKKIEVYKEIMPSEVDVKGVTDALLRLQETYHLKTQDLVKGKIQNITSDYVLNSEDCFNIGVHAYDKKNYAYAVKWFKEAYNLFNVENRKKNFDLIRKLDILDYLSYCLGSIGKYKAALKFTNELLSIPNINSRDRLLQNKQWYLERLSTEVVDESQDEEFMAVEEDGTYSSLCRGENPIQYPQNVNNLRCFYRRNHPLLKLRPLKVEIAFDRPRLYILHDILYDQEIDHIKKVAAPKLNRATVRNPSTGVLEVANYRISKSAWLPYDTDEVTIRINKRITAVTGLSVEMAEDLQVVNYGIGGHYSPHFDHGRKRPEDDFDIERGNRIATLLFYMSDVEAGGATVFIDIGAKLWPKKGSAAFWYNLKRSGKSDDMTRHAACPVLMGTKWVMNKWFRERGQEFTRRCSLREED